MGHHLVNAQAGVARDDVNAMGSAQSVAHWSRVRRLLAIRVDNLGDVLMTTPALAAARQSLPHCQITLMTGPDGALLAPHLPMVDSVMPVRAPWVRHEDHGSAEDGRTIVKRMAEGRFDAAVIFTVCTQSALPAATLCTLAGIRLRIAHVRENPYGLLSDHVPETDVDLVTARHEVRRQLDLVRAVGWRCDDERLRFRVPAQDAARLGSLLDAQSQPRSAGAPLVVMHVGASAPSRRWPAERFGMAAAAIARACRAQIVFTGSHDEIPLVETARNAMRCASGPVTPRDAAAAPSAAAIVDSTSLAGKLSLGELGALLSRADLLVTNNSGPAHLAAALGTPVVDLYALTNPQHTPWMTPSRVLYQDVPCRNCLRSRCPQGHHLCLAGVAAQDVTSAALSLLHERRAKAPASFLEVKS